MMKEGNLPDSFPGASYDMVAYTYQMVQCLVLYDDIDTVENASFPADFVQVTFSF